MEFDDKPMGYWMRRHIANDPRWTKHYVPATLGPMLSAPEPGFPDLKPAFMASRQYLYAPDAVDRFFDELDAWVAAAPARAEARRLENQRSIAAAAAEFEAKAKLQREIRQSGIDAQAEAEANRAKRREEAERQAARMVPHVPTPVIYPTGRG